MLVRSVLLLALGLCSGVKVEMEGEACHDGYVDCSNRAELCRAEDYHQLLQMMTHCRTTCRQFFENKVGMSSWAWQDYKYNKYLCRLSLIWWMSSVDLIMLSQTYLGRT